MYFGLWFYTGMELRLYATRKQSDIHYTVQFFGRIPADILIAGISLFPAHRHIQIST